MQYNFDYKNWDLHFTEIFNVFKCRSVITHYSIIRIQICSISSPGQKLSPHYYRKDNSYYNTILRVWSCQNNSYLYWGIFLRVALVVVESRRVHWYLSLYTEVIHHTQYFSSISYSTSTITQHDSNHSVEESLAFIHFCTKQNQPSLYQPCCMFRQSEVTFKMKIFLNSELVFLGPSCFCS